MMPPAGSAPTFIVPPREIVALEHPMIIQNIDNGLKTLGSGIPLHQLLSADGYEGCFPLYLRTVDPACAPLLSNNTPSSNVLLKITVPKRTGRKRKRGSDGPYTIDPITATREDAHDCVDNGKSTSLLSHSRLDNPKDLLRSLKDNVGKYRIEPVGSIDQTHRYRGMTDFHYSTSHGKFMTKFRETILPGNVESLRKFKLDPSRGVKQNDELIPPPTFSDKTTPINWGYHQNSNIKVTTDQTTGETILTNQSRAQKINTYYVPYDTPQVPDSPPPLPPPDPILQSLLTELHTALSERPIWTRRAIMNRIPRSNPGIYLLKPAIQYVGYQFRGGPWRDAIVRYGIDPRSSPDYRIYQTLFFKIVDQDEPATAAASAGGGGGGAAAAAAINRPWHDKRSEYTRRANPDSLDPNSHIFDGTRVSLDGKIWQVCDITDPLLVRLLATPTLRPACDLHSDGWYCNGTWAKVRAIMRTKISAIRLGREMRESDFRQTLLMPDEVKDKARVTAHMPNLGLPPAAAAAALADCGGDDGNSDADGGAVLPAAAAGTSGKAWRQRKMKGLKRQDWRRVGGASNMGPGRQGSSTDGRNLGAGGLRARQAAAKGQGQGPGTGNEAANAGESGAARTPVGGDVGPHSEAVRRDALRGEAQLAAPAAEVRAEAARAAVQGVDPVVGEEALDGEGEDGDQDGDEDDDNDDDDDDDDDEEELDGDGW